MSISVFILLVLLVIGFLMIFMRKDPETSDAGSSESGVERPSLFELERAIKQQEENKNPLHQDSHDSPPPIIYDAKPYIQVTYSIPLMDVYDEQFEMKISQRDYDRLQEADGDGEDMDNRYLAKRHNAMHKKILRAIRRDMKEKGDYPGDGLVDVDCPIGGSYKEYRYPSHEDMYLDADNRDIEYYVIL